MRITLFLYSILFYGISAYAQEGFLSGLHFDSHEVIQEKRTSLNLTPVEPFKFPKGFSLETEANFRHGDGHFGYIFRIIGDNHTNIDLVSNLASGSSNFWLVLKDKVLFSYKWSEVPIGGFDQWIKIRIDIDIPKSKLSISFNGNKKELLVPEISGLANFDVVFGACRNSSFLNMDVCPMSLKNVRIFDSNDRMIRDWKLSKHVQTKVYDEINHEEALVENPDWNIDKHVNWRKLKDIKIDSILGITKDDEQGRIFFINARYVYILSTQTLVIDTIPFAGGLPYNSLGKQIIYNKFTDELWSYNFNEGDISKFSFVTNKWSIKATTTKEPHYWHHNKFISPVDSSLVTLFGYGYYTYKSIINRIQNNGKGWEQTDRKDQIQPRYLSSNGLLNNKTMLVFGGYGSKTGRQELSPEFYYDLYSLDLEDYSFSKLWTLAKPSKPFVPCEALIADQKSDRFYTLVYNSGNFATYLRLARFGIKKNDYHIFNDSIPFNFLDTQSWSTLILDQKTSQLIALTSHGSDVSLYSIAYPPLMPEDVYQVVSKKTGFSFWVIIGFSALVLIYILISKKIIRLNREKLFDHVDHQNILPVEPIKLKTSSAIFFMGGFQVFDRNGLNMTSSFPPTLKQLFLFIFMHSVLEAKGVSSATLDEVLWYDKLGESARNNRNVNISKLRAVLDEIGEVEILNENSFWKIKMGESVYCDFTEILELLGKSKSMIIIEPEIQKLIALLLLGEFLPQMQNEWTDSFKSRFGNVTTEALRQLFNEKWISKNANLMYHLAECILVYDPLNEEAFSIKCSVLYHLGKKGMAKNMYDTYCRDYKAVLGIEYTNSFNHTIR